MWEFKNYHFQGPYGELFFLGGDNFNNFLFTAGSDTPPFGTLETRSKNLNMLAVWQMLLNMTLQCDFMTSLHSVHTVFSFLFVHFHRPNGSSSVKEKSQKSNDKLNKSLLSARYKSCFLIMILLVPKFLREKLIELSWL